MQAAACNGSFALLVQGDSMVEKGASDKPIEHFFIERVVNLHKRYMESARVCAPSTDKSDEAL